MCEGGGGGQRRDWIWGAGDGVRVRGGGIYFPTPT
jgi:hypothetical protein